MHCDFYLFIFSIALSAQDCYDYLESSVIYYEFLEFAFCTVMNIIEMFINLPFTFNCLSVLLCICACGVMEKEALSAPKLQFQQGMSHIPWVLGLNSNPLEENTAILTSEPPLQAIATGILMDLYFENKLDTTGSPQNL